MILSTKCLQVNSLRPLKAITTVFQIYIHKLQQYDLEPEIASSDVSTMTSDENTSSSDSEIADYCTQESATQAGVHVENVFQCQLTLRVFAVATQMK